MLADGCLAVDAAFMFNGQQHAVVLSTQQHLVPQHRKSDATQDPALGPKPDAATQLHLALLRVHSSATIVHVAVPTANAPEGSLLLRHIGAALRGVGVSTLAVSASPAELVRELPALAQAVRAGQERVGDTLRHSAVAAVIARHHGQATSAKELCEHLQMLVDIGADVTQQQAQLANLAAKRIATQPPADLQTIAALLSQLHTLHDYFDAPQRQQVAQALAEPRRGAVVTGDLAARVLRGAAQLRVDIANCRGMLEAALSKHAESLDVGMAADALQSFAVLYALQQSTVRPSVDRLYQTLLARRGALSPAAALQVRRLRARGHAVEQPVLTGIRSVQPGAPHNARSSLFRKS